MEQTFKEIRDCLARRIMILDGAMGTRIQAFGLPAESFHKGRFEHWPVSLVGNNDVLCLTAPDVIKGIHRLYVEAGADIIAAQECVTESAAEKIRGNLKNKDSFEVLSALGCHNVILYNKDVYTLVEKGCRKIANEGDAGSKYERYNFWAKFRSNESGFEFVVVCIHIDYEEEACAAQLRTILDFMEETYPGVPAVMLGDYNANERKLKTEYLTGAGYTDVKKVAVTTQGADLDTYLSEDSPSKNDIIDFIFTTGLTAQYYEVMDKDFNPSDHRPIRAILYMD